MKKFAKLPYENNLESVIYNKNNFEINSNYNREFAPPATDFVKYDYKTSVFNSMTKDTDSLKQSIVIDKKELALATRSDLGQSRPRSSIFTSYSNNIGFKQLTANRT